jgi:hypothetical protein
VAADAASAARPDGVEILELRWFSREELAEATAEIALPGETSIARWLLERWYGGPIVEGTPWEAPHTPETTPHTPQSTAQSPHTPQEAQ